MDKISTDYVKLFDRGAAELSVHGTEEDLATIVESRTHPLAEPPVWREYFATKEQAIDAFPKDASSVERLRAILESQSLADVKDELMSELCTGDWLYLDYSGCMEEVFSGGEPPGSITWEQFIAPMSGGKSPQSPGVPEDDGTELRMETSGWYLLTSANTESMILSLRKNIKEVRIMTDAEISKLERWHDFCRRHERYCVPYQSDF